MVAYKRWSLTCRSFTNSNLTDYISPSCTTLLHFPQLSNGRCNCFFRVDNFLLRVESVGIVDRIAIEHDNSGFFPDWDLNKVGSLETTDSPSLLFLEMILIIIGAMLMLNANLRIHYTLIVIHIPVPSCTRQCFLLAAR